MADRLQQALLEQIIASFEKKSDAVERLSSLMNLGKDAIYRRLRGDTLLTPEEISLLAKTFGISVDNLVFQDVDSVIFNMSSVSGKINSFQDFFDDLNGNVEGFAFPRDAFMYHSTSEVPLFYYFLFPELLEFKLYVWGKHIWDFDYLTNQPFRKGLIPADLIQSNIPMLQNWLRMESAEMWSINLFDNILNQIEFHAAMGGFEDFADALALCDALNRMSDHFYEMAEKGKKFKPGSYPEAGSNFELYHNEMVSAYNTIYLSSPANRIVYVTFGSPNFIKSTDTRVCDFMEKWIKTILNKSIMISTRAEKERMRFFQVVKRRIEQTRKRVALYAEEL